MRYEKLRKKYRHLPALRELKKNFGIEGSGEEDVIKGISRKLKGIGNYLESLLLGETYKTFVERSFLSKKQKEEASRIYREIQVILTQEFILKLENSEKAKAEWIKSADEFWKRNKDTVLRILKTIVEGWKRRRAKVEKQTSYHG